MSIPHTDVCGASSSGASRLVDTLAQAKETSETYLALAIATRQHYPSGSLLEWVLRHRSQPISLTPVSAYLLFHVISSIDPVIQHTLKALKLSACAACWQELRQRFPALELPPFPTDVVSPSLCLPPSHTLGAAGGVSYVA